MTATAIDDVLEGTFPASDPPAWTAGIAGPAPAVSARRVNGAAATSDAIRDRADVIDVSRPRASERTFARGLVSLMAAAGLAMFVPLAILAIGAPVALAIRGALEVVGRMLAFVG